MTQPTLELIQFLRERIKDTYALDDKQKEEILSHIETLSVEQIEKVLETIVHYEWLITKDSRNFKESTEQESEKQAMQQIFEDIIF